MADPRWDLAITHRDPDCVPFVTDYFDHAERKVLLIAGAGFDPRATILAETLGGLSKPSLRAVLIRESRSGESDPDLHVQADANFDRLAKLMPDHQVLTIEVFSPDGKVTGGRTVAAKVSDLDITDVTDLIVDVSALSIGISFPVIRWVIEVPSKARPELNVHLFVAHKPEIDGLIKATPSDSPVRIHGFDGRLHVSSENQRTAKLWLPQLAKGRAASLRRIYDTLQVDGVDEVCVVLPFPSGEPRSGDALLEEMLTLAGGIPWDGLADPRSIVYADESDPLDLYRTIMRLQTLRDPVFAETGGSTLILSPLGSKVMGLGALLAALERDLPVIYLEDFSYSLAIGGDETLSTSEPELMHVWLEGSPYPFPRSPLFRSAGS